MKTCDCCGGDLDSECHKDLHFVEEARSYLTKLRLQRDEVLISIEHFEGVLDGTVDPTI